jgi:hypothetical protein
MMPYINRLKANPLSLLLYLEWILFIISILGQFRFPNMPLPPIKVPPLFPVVKPDLSLESFLLLDFGQTAK